MPGPCAPWTTEAAVRGQDGGCSGAEGCRPWNDEARFPSATVALWIMAASQALYQLLGRRWPGECEATITPVCAEPDHPVLPLPAGGTVELLLPPVTEMVGAAFMCGGGTVVRLDTYPVIAVDEVVIDGEVLDPAAYRVDNHRWLVRLDGGRWPCVPPHRHADDAFLVSVLYGGAPPELGERATVDLTRQLLLATCGDGGCTLSAQAKSVVREGVALDFVVGGITEALKNGNTGVPSCDLAIFSYNPNGLRRRARVLQPAASGTVARSERRTWP